MYWFFGSNASVLINTKMKNNVLFIYQELAFS